MLAIISISKLFEIQTRNILFGRDTVDNAV